MKQEQKDKLLDKLRQKSMGELEEIRKIISDHIDYRRVTRWEPTISEPNFDPQNFYNDDGSETKSKAKTPQTTQVDSNGSVSMLEHFDNVFFKHHGSWDPLDDQY